MKQKLKNIGKFILIVLGVVVYAIVFLILYEILGYFNIGADGS